MRDSKIKPLDFKLSRLDKEEWQVLKKLSTPQKIQDFLNLLPFNFEKRGQTHRSVRYALKYKQAHCFEGALIAASALWIGGRRPHLLDLVTVPGDFDHVVVLCKEDGAWGAISKTNHAVLRYREPVYRNVRELVMSYFHEYFLDNGKKTLRTYSRPFDLSRLSTDWLITEDDLVSLAHKLDRSPHQKILSLRQIKNLRKAEEVEIKAGKIVEYKK